MKVDFRKIKDAIISIAILALLVTTFVVTTGLYFNYEWAYNFVELYWMERFFIPSINVFYGASFAFMLVMWRRWRAANGDAIGHETVFQHYTVTWARPRPAANPVPRLMWLPCDLEGEEGQTRFFATKQIAERMGDLCRIALKCISSPMLRFTSDSEVGAFKNAASAIGSGKGKGEYKPYVIISTCSVRSNPSQTLCNRYVVIEMQLLLLFTCLDFCKSIYVEFPHQKARVLMLHQLACQFFSGQVEAEGNGYVYTVRWLALNDSFSPVDFSEDRWYIDHEEISLEELEALRTRLHEAFKRAKEAYRARIMKCTPVPQDTYFTCRLISLGTSAQVLAPRPVRV